LSTKKKTKAKSKSKTKKSINKKSLPKLTKEAYHAIFFVKEDFLIHYLSTYSEILVILYI